MIPMSFFTTLKASLLAVGPFYWLAGMNGGSHAAMASWGLDLANVSAEGEILDIGCGGGANLSAAGFRDIVVHLNESKHWLCAIAIK